MSRVWTENQKKAIEARGSEILVSAAAGSGKTAVLTERVKNILADTENRTSVSELLVVTFTKAAAGEMKDRISAALKAEISKSKDPTYIKRQISLLPTADICTIDSFCAKTVREHFHSAGTSPDFKILDENDNTVLMNETAGEVISQLYEKGGSDFETLNTMFLTDRDDSRLSSVIISLYKFSRSYPSPEKWLSELNEWFSPKKSVDETPWTGIIFDYAKLMCDYYIGLFNNAVFYMNEAGGFNSDCISVFEGTADNLSEIYINAKKGDWDGFVKRLYDSPVIPYKFMMKNVDEDVKSYIKYVYSSCKKGIEDLQGKTLPSSAEHSADIENLYPAVSVLVGAVNMFSEILLEKKTALDTFSFDDILHKCINLLVEFNDESYEKTAVADELSKIYSEILIDEYQDTNEAQNIIFESISRQKSNFYCVGDVKQSIYRFRLASPELFMKMRRELPDYNGDKVPSQITLEKNFRSRKGITDAVNYTFSKLMSRDVGDISYDKREYLYCGANYENELQLTETELHLLDVRRLKVSDAAVLEAEHIAEYIKKTVCSGATVRDGAGCRPVTYNDFCVLMRSTKNRSALYSETFNKLGIPTSFVSDGAIGFSKETELLISVIKTVANPLLDIHLTAFLMSPLCGFTADELSEIRLIDKNADLFLNLAKYAKSNSKAELVLKKLALYRNISVAYPVSDFVKFIIDDTSIGSVYLSTENGEERVSNIAAVKKAAKAFTDSGRRGLSAFIRYLDNMVENGSLKNDTGALLLESSVKIMSIHKSKGLEFPYVIIADCGKKFNLSDSRDILTVSRETGIGLKIRNDEQFTQYNTLSSVATEKAIIKGEISEELRVLYVAMTRAKEHLIFSCPLYFDTVLERVHFSCISADSTAIHPFSVLSASSICEWLLYVFALHPDCGELRELAGVKAGFEEKTSEFNLIFEYEDLRGRESDEEKAPEATEKALPDKAIIDEIIKRTSFKYPYDELSGVLAKRTASSYEAETGKREFFASAKPKLACEKLSGAEKGTAVHKFLELSDFSVASKDVDAEVTRLVAEKLLTTEDADVLDRAAVNAFFDSPVGKRLLNSDRVVKEYEFSVLRKACEIYEGLSENSKNERIVVEGKLDCAFFEPDGAILIDYKTDNISDESVLISAYRQQLMIYKDALQECEDVKVKEIYIYSFKLKKFIELKV